MARSLPLLLLVACLVGCHRQLPAPVSTSPPSKPKVTGEAVGSKDAPLIETRVPGGGREEWGELAFDIQRIYSNQKAAESAPWHVDGGDWTFFDCQVPASPPIAFIVGVHSRSRVGKTYAWGEATILVPNPEIGQGGQATRRQPWRARNHPSLSPIRPCLR